MGEYLSTPNKEKHSTDDQNSTVCSLIFLLIQLKYGACGMQGWRKSMEDAHVTALDVV